jgi:NADP-dependent 3-hydroxy acid dehydrogenase YdfG
LQLTAETVVVITGASSGIGRALAETLAPRGVRLALMARSGAVLNELETELRRTGAGDVLIRAGDVGDPEAAPAWIGSILDRWGRLDALVNNAGIGIMKPVAELTDADWDTTLATNLSGPFRLIRAALPAMRGAGAGHIVNVSSVAGQVGFAGGGAYCASKFALEGLSDCLMQEVRKEGVKVTVIEPGSVDTNFDAKESPQAGAKDTSWKIAPEEIARTIVYALESPTGTMPNRIQVRPTLQNKPQ